MSNPWFRMYSEFANDPKVQMLSEVMQRRFVMIMCLRCSNTLVTLHETEIAFQLRITESELAETKALFIAKHFIDDQWNVLNWEKRQFVSDSSAARVSRFREKKKEEVKQACNVTETKSNGVDTEQNRTDTEKKKQKNSSPSGSRLAQDWSLPADWKTWAEQERPELDVLTQAASFADYWHGVAGAKGRKADWLATWRNWIRNSNSGSRPRAGPTMSQEKSKGRQAIELLEGLKHGMDAQGNRNGTAKADMPRLG